MNNQNEYRILCDDGEEVTIFADNKVAAMWQAIERGYKPVEEPNEPD